MFEDEVEETCLMRTTTLMEKEYGSKNELNKNLTVFTPEEGMTVAAMFKGDGKWYRCEIAKIHPNNLFIDVMFVDFGNIQSVHFSQIRYLKKEFFEDIFVIIFC
jgi:hypothetical protein